MVQVLEAWLVFTFQSIALKSSRKMRSGRHFTWSTAPETRDSDYIYLPLTTLAGGDQMNELL